MAGEADAEIVRRAFEAFERGDGQTLADLTDAEIITHRAPPQPDAGTWHGREGLQAVYSGWIEGFDDFTMEPVELRALDENRVLLRLHQTAVGRESRVPIAADFWLVNTVVDGRIARLDIYPSERDALDALS